MVDHKDWSIIKLLKWLNSYFIDKKIDNSQFEAEQLIAYMLGCRRLDLYVQYEKKLTNEQLKISKSLIRQRLAGDSISYITGQAYFWRFELKVNRSVLVPRRETEILVQAVLDLPTDFLHNPKLSILDLGTGSGAIAIALLLELDKAQILASDISEEALKVTQNNLALVFKSSLVGDRAEVKKSDKLSQLTGKKFNLIVTNPPYIKTSDIKNLDLTVQNEPTMALDGGDDGLSFYRYLAENAALSIESSGFLAFEHGDKQKEAIMDIFSVQEKFIFFTAKQDYLGKDRVIIYQLTA
ncbi:MAG: peptide chain release factor N(5)-glutamine methyltransferase [SAR324 cluster bacterium]|nr:peptide chain release factor N(5)-glutamine methyltransferase [SAR324 cluster bacterium]